MNLQLHRVISDITGKTGLKIIRAILAGERNPQQLASFKDGRIRRTTLKVLKLDVSLIVQPTLFV